MDQKSAGQERSSGSPGRRRASLLAAGLALASTVAAGTPPAAGTSPAAGTPPAARAAPGWPARHLAAPAPSARRTVGGPQLAGHGIVVNYPPHGRRLPRAWRLPRVRASAYVVADAGTGQVLAAKDPHGWY